MAGFGAGTLYNLLYSACQNIFSLALTENPTFTTSSLSSNYIEIIDSSHRQFYRSYNTQAHAQKEHKKNLK